MSICKKPHAREKSRSRIISIIMSKLAQNRDFSTSKTLFFHLSHRIGLISHIMQVLNGQKHLQKNPGPGKILILHNQHNQTSKYVQNRDFSTSKALFFNLSHWIGLISHTMQVLNGQKHLQNNPGSGKILILHNQHNYTSKYVQNRDFSTSKALFFNLSHWIGLISHICKY